MYNTPEEFGRAAVFSEVASHSSKCAKSSKNFCHNRHVSSILKEGHNIINLILTYCFQSTSKTLFLSRSHPVILPESPFHGQGTDAPPAAIKATGGLLDGVTLCICGAGITVVQKHLTQIQYRCHTRTVLFDVTLKLLNGQSMTNRKYVSLHVVHMQSDVTLPILYCTYTHSIRCCALLPVAVQASSEFPASHRSHKRWAWTDQSLCGQARSVGWSCFYPIVVQPPEFL